MAFAMNCSLGQSQKFVAYLSKFPLATYPFVCCTPYSQKIEDDFAKEFIFSQKIAPKFGLYEDSGYQFGHTLLKTQTHTVLIVNQINSLWRANRQVILVYELETSQISDIILACGRKLLAPINGVEQYEDYSFSFDSSGKLTLKDAIFMITEDGIRKADKNEQILQLSASGVFVKFKKK
ncbi:MAG: hypothetical protein SNJ77_13015 [Cytophagales bacterium]